MFALGHGRPTGKPTAGRTCLYTRAHMCTHARTIASALQVVELGDNSLTGTPSEPTFQFWRRYFSFKVVEPGDNSLADTPSRSATTRCMCTTERAKL